MSPQRRLQQLINDIVKHQHPNTYMDCTITNVIDFIEEAVKEKITKETDIFKRRKDETA